jgi:hypothetical protein
MAIPESQLDVWSQVGAQEQSKNTYAVIRNALDRSEAPYFQKGKNVSIFLQVSYGNDTNVYRESDVDVVIQMTGSTFYYDTDLLTPDELQRFNQYFGSSPASYGFFDFKADVLSHLKARFGADVTSGSKAISIAANGGRRKADALACVDYRRYITFPSATSDGTYVPGICFFTTGYDRVANFPNLHSSQLTTKHRATNQWFKPVVRIVKNMRNRLIADETLGSGVAPSYYIEGLLHNAPDKLFGTSYEDCFVNVINWIWAADRTTFRCAHRQYQLLDGNKHVTWRSADCTTFLTALKTMWREWNT